MLTFQNLPLHIAHIIARHYASCFSDSSLDQGSPWLHLYNTSHLWRLVALSHLCTTAQITLNEPGALFADLPDSLRDSQDFRRLYRHVRSVKLSIDCTDSSTFAPLADQQPLLSAVWPTDAVFPSAHTLRITKHGMYGGTLYHNAHFGDAYFRNVADRIRLAMPCLQRVIFCSDICTDHQVSFNVPVSSDWDAATYLSPFVKSEVWWGVSDHSSPVPDPFIPLIPDIVSLDYDCVFNKDIFHTLLIRSAHTLKTLSVVFFGPEIAKPLLFNATGLPLTYPNLTRLDIRGPCDDFFPCSLRTDPAIAAFPNLRFLRWEPSYTFADDTLFRGSYHSLESLNICLHSRAFDSMYQCGLFAANVFSSLYHVSIKRCYTHFPQQPFDRFPRVFGGMIVPTTRSLTVLGALVTYSLAIDTITSSSYANNIQALSLASAALDLDQMLALVRSLPSMVYITCKARGPPGTMLDIRMDSADCPLPDQVYRELYPLSRRLRRWVVSPEQGISAQTLVVYAVTLAILCPSFALAVVPAANVQEYRNELQSILAKGLCADHTDKIKRLCC